MNTWKILKEELVKGSTPGTLGRHVKLNQCLDIFALIEPNLIDREASTLAMKKDEDMAKAWRMRAAIKELNEIGVL